MIEACAKMALGLTAAAAVAESVIPEPFAGIIQFGALGLCAYMVLMNERDRRRMAEAMDRKEHSAAQERQRMAEALERKEATTAARHLVESEKLERLHVETLEAIRKCKKE